MDDEHALELVRDIVATLNTRETAGPGHRSPEDPLYDPAELYGVVPQTFREVYDVREVIARLVDGSRFHEFKALYGTTLVTGFARIDGYPVGIIANNGILFSESALKGAHFIELCTSAAHPAAVSCRTSPASWWAEPTRPAASPRTGPRWCTPWPTPRCPS